METIKVGLVITQEAVAEDQVKGMTNQGTQGRCRLSRIETTIFVAYFSEAAVAGGGGGESAITQDRL
ncbi:hypothetical protein EYF80_034689 [Liparis tanakae]|uniref:Uncharacterized protein n=1 Tax=Liparis tanakae TaxID=230148 RepID=A0A4Z2GPS2_9TELE|nr:hypothetical protein EYF80_034689 [Liparis tanakae]